jgi:hypothetical protein
MADTPGRKEAHSWDMQFMKELHKPACLTAHHGKFTDGNTCSYRWQGYLKALTAKRGTRFVYRWPKNVKGPRTPGAWDIGVAGNFQEKARKPWPHEAHHIVAYAELANAIIDIGKDAKAEVEVRKKVRRGLAEEKYNLNAKLNMIILPKGKKPSDALGLPKHLKTTRHRSHPAYSKHIRGRLNGAFRPMQEKVEDCGTLPKYKKSRSKVERISRTTYPEILSAHPAGFTYLDEAAKGDHFGGRPRRGGLDD